MRQLRLVVKFYVLALPVLAQNIEWQPVVHGAGLFFKLEQTNGIQPTCVVRVREDKKLRRTISDLIVTYRFEKGERNENYSVQFAARDTDTLYLDHCESVLNVVATKVQRR